MQLAVAEPLLGRAKTVRVGTEGGRAEVSTSRQLVIDGLAQGDLRRLDQRPGRILITVAAVSWSLAGVVIIGASRLLPALIRLM